jgi:putative oxidoreductase
MFPIVSKNSQSFLRNYSSTENVHRASKPRLHGLKVLFADRGRVPSLDLYGTFLARLFLSQVFLFSGLQKIVAWNEIELLMAAKGMVGTPFFHVCATMIELVFGLGLLLGFKSRLSAIVLSYYLVIVTLVFHNFWLFDNPVERSTNFTALVQNLAVVGGLISIAAHGPGLLSLGRTGRRATKIQTEEKDRSAFVRLQRVKK